MSDNYNPDEHDQTMFTNDQKLKLIQLVNEGCQVLHETETLKSGLSDTVKAVAEELNIKAAILNKAIKVAHKMEFGREQKDHELLENILTTVGKTL
jgi:transposase-like protein